MSQNSAPIVDIQDDAITSVISSIIACMVLAGVTVVGRLASRKIQKSILSTSDYLCVAGLIGAWGVSLIIIAEARLGLGKYSQVVSMASVRDIQLMTFIGEILYTIAFTMLKISILLLYRGLFPGNDMVLATNIIGAFVVMWGIAVALASIFSCNPVHGFWDLTVQSTCVNTQWFYVGNAIPNIMADIAILGLPVRKVWNLQMSKKSKVGVSVIFLLGGFVIVASAVRLYFIVNINVAGLSWTIQGVGLWSAVEIDVAVISACLPTIRPILRLLASPILARLLSSAKKSSNNNATSEEFRMRESVGKRYKEEFRQLKEYNIDVGEECSVQKHYL